MTGLELFHQHKNFALAFATRLTRDIPAQERRTAQQSALIGLWLAIKNYEGGKASLKTYARYRIKGEIIDEARRHMPFGRHAGPALLEGFADLEGIRLSPHHQASQAALHAQVRLLLTELNSGVDLL